MDHDGMDHDGMDQDRMAPYGRNARTTWLKVSAM